MKKAAMLATLAIVLCWIPTSARAATPTISAGGGGHNVLAGSRDGIWSEPPDLEGLIASSEVIGQLGLETEIANDFYLTHASPITVARWWGGYYNNNGCGDIGVATNWNLRFYDDGGCVPDAVLSEYVNVQVYETFVYCQGGSYPIFQYEAWGVEFMASANRRYWFSAQASDHTYPPQCGRLASANVVGCDTAFKSAYFAYSDWAPVIDVFGVTFDASQEFDSVIFGGPCCLPDGSCVEVDVVICGDFYGGEVQWDVFHCEDAECPSPQACCFSGGFCQMVTDWGCLDRGGEPQGSGTVCDPDPCEQVTTGCIDYGGYLHWVCQLTMPGTPYGVAASGGLAYVADDYSGLLIVDTNLHEPRIVGVADTPGHAYRVAVSGGYAYVGDSESGLQVIDVKDPQNPLLVGHLDAEGSTSDVAASGTYAFISGPDIGFEVVDVANPQQPQVVGSVPDLVGPIAVSGTYAFVANGAGLQVLDIRNPRYPHIVGSVETPDEATGVAVRDTYAYVADSHSGLQVVDISNPAGPEIVGSVDTPGLAYAVAVTATHAYVAGGSGLAMIDIRDPKNPRFERSFESSGCYSAAVSANRVYFNDAAGRLLDAIAISNPEPPPILGGIGMPDYASNLVIADNLAYVADYHFGLQIVDITDPYHLRILGGTFTPGSAGDLDLSGNYAHVADWLTGLQIIDVGDPRNPRLVGGIITPGDAYGLDVKGLYTYVVGGNDGNGHDGSFEVIDVSDPQSPQIVSAIGLPSSSRDVVVSGAHAYVAGGNSGLQVIDISDPANPTIVSNLSVFSYADDIFVQGNYAYIAYGTSGLLVVDIGDPTNPRGVAEIDTPGRARGIAIRGGYAYIADGESGLQVIDITSPEVYRIVGNVDTPLDCGQVEVMGSYVYATDGHALLVLPAQCDPAGTPDPTDIVSTVGLRAYPNPTSGQAVIRMHTSTQGIVRTTIHDIGGRLLRNLHDGVLRQGDQELIWNGRDDAGRPVAPGIYLARVSTNEGTSTARIVILR